MYSANYYDIRGRLINTVSSNNMGGYDKTTTVYTFTGKPKTVTHVHTASGKATQTQVYTYTYDHAERLDTLKHKLNAGPVVTLANNTYDNLGRLKKNNRNGQTSLADNYTYNIRSWITRISGTQFTEDLTYKFNGNIATMQWNTNNQTRKYTYNYDALSRLTSAAYNGATTAEKNNTSYSYDKHGNIKTLQRYGKTTSTAYGLVDNLTMSYSGNQLTNVSDAGVTVSLAESNDFKKGFTTNPGYAYNKNGTMTKDLNKKITDISYNSLNLPKQLTINGTTHTYTYAADGRKLKVMQGSTDRDYAGSVIYENGSLKRILVEGGYIEGGVYYFNFNDHLGNASVVANASGTAIQRDHYYPFGLPMAETSDTEQNKQPYKYNGKEFERKDGLNWMDYGARNYDAAVGRFTTMDPMAEKYYSVSPYAYCNNNPMRFVDPDGMAISPYFDSDGNLLGVDEYGFQGTIYITTQDTFEKHSTKGVADSQSIQDDTATKSIDASNILSIEAESNIYTTVMLNTSGVDFSKLYNGKVSIVEKIVIDQRGNKRAIGYNNPDSYSRHGFSITDKGEFKVTAKSGSYYNDFKTVEGIQNYLGVHEYDGHGNKGFSGGANPGGTHWKAYELQSKHSTFKALPTSMQQEIKGRIKSYMAKENVNLYKKRY